MNHQIAALVLVSAFTGSLWVPYVLNRIAVRGVGSTVGYPIDPPPLAPWAQRLRAAHANAAENLVVFAALILAAQVMRVDTPVTEGAAWLYLWARVVHAVVYALGVPWLRTLAFTAGWAAQMLVAWQLLEA